MKKTWNYIFLFIVICAGMFLRFYKIVSNYFFTGELGKELLYIRQFAMNGSPPLVGMSTSHEWLSYGPIYYWIMIPIFNIFNGNPFILFWSALVVAVAGLVLNYFVFKNIAGEKIATISTVIQSFSPLLILQTRLSKLHVFFWIIMPVFTYLMYKLWNGNKKLVFWSGITFGILFSFHFSQIPLLGVIGLLFLIKKNIYRIKDWFLFLAGLLAPNVTFLWQDIKLLAWVPYRILNLADKNPGGTWQSILEFLGKNIFWNPALLIIGFLIFVLIFADYVYRNRKNIKTDFMPFYLISSIGLMLIANILHGASPIHYYSPIFTLVPVLFAVYLERVKFWPVIVVGVLIVNLYSFNNDALFYKPNDKLIPETGMVPYYIQDGLTSFIVKSAGGRDIKINRVGPFDYFPDRYAQNYKYLILWKGGKINDNSRDVYSIVEDVHTQNIYVQK